MTEFNHSERLWDIQNIQKKYRVARHLDAAMLPVLLLISLLDAPCCGRPLAPLPPLPPAPLLLLLLLRRPPLLQPPPRPHWAPLRLAPPLLLRLLCARTLRLLRACLPWLLGALLAVLLGALSPPVQLFLELGVFPAQHWVQVAPDRRVGPLQLEVCSWTERGRARSIEFDETMKNSPIFMNVQVALHRNIGPLQLDAWGWAGGKKQQCAGRRRKKGGV